MSPTTTLLAAVPPLDLPHPQVRRSIRPDQLSIDLRRDHPGQVGRLTAGQAISRLGWSPGHHVHATVRDGLIILTSVSHKPGAVVITITDRGDLRLSARICHLAWLTKSDQVLVA